MGWVVHTGSLGWAPVLLYLAGIAWTLFYDTIYAHQDKEDDALIGIKSTARLFDTKTKGWLLGFMAISVTLLAAALVVAVDSRMNIMALLVAILGIWAFGMHLAWQMRSLDIDDAENCLRVFRSNRNAGLLPIAGFISAIALQMVFWLA
jgi:4-hydroxybenzoate polyprenyltransferase